MNRNIFSAWYCLVVLGLYLVIYFARLPFIGPVRAQSAFAVMSLLAFLPVFLFTIFRKEQNDERDMAFLQRSFLVGMANGFCVIVAIDLTLIARFLYLGIETVPLLLIWIPVLCGLFVTMLVGSVVLLLLYYKGENADKEHGF